MGGYNGPAAGVQQFGESRRDQRSGLEDEDEYTDSGEDLRGHDGNDQRE
ncbi:hypothetical protein [Nocardia abscessus]|nr:hypothetical protein [Nocardia abscessus]